MIFPKPTLYPLDSVDENMLKYAVVCARYQGKWIFCRHKSRETWELPGGHIEAGETPWEAAHRELYEETGAVDSEITAVGIYKLFDYGLLCFAEVNKLSSIPEGSEIAEIRIRKTLPQKLTYAGVHDLLYKWVQDCLSDQTDPRQCQTKVRSSESLRDNPGALNYGREEGT